jgi:hypothetical protein
LFRSQSFLERLCERLDFEQDRLAPDVFSIEAEAPERRMTKCGFHPETRRPEPEL